ncbi:MAG: hypothetical protein GY795_28960 [Desulfobacterales bacterium]|nr:hypothetical protein [Desulfobacterales bacterium]
MIEFTEVVQTKAGKAKGRFVHIGEKENQPLINAVNNILSKSLGDFSTKVKNDVEWLAVPILDENKSLAYYLLGTFKPPTKNDRGAPFHGCLITKSSLQENSGNDLRYFVKAWKELKKDDSDWLNNNRAGKVKLRLNTSFRLISSENTGKFSEILQELENGKIVRLAHLNEPEVFSFLDILRDIPDAIQKYSWTTASFDFPGKSYGADLHVAVSKDGKQSVKSGKIEPILLKYRSPEKKTDKKVVINKINETEDNEHPKGTKRFSKLWLVTPLLLIFLMAGFLYIHQKNSYDEIISQIRISYYKKVISQSDLDLITSGIKLLCNKNLTPMETKDLKFEVERFIKKIVIPSENAIKKLEYIEQQAIKNSGQLSAIKNMVSEKKIWFQLIINLKILNYPDAYTQLSKYIEDKKNSSELLVQNYVSEARKKLKICLAEWHHKQHKVIVDKFLNYIDEQKLSKQKLSDLKKELDAYDNIPGDYSIGDNDIMEISNYINQSEKLISQSEKLKIKLENRK